MNWNLLFMSSLEVTYQLLHFVESFKSYWKLGDDYCYSKQNRQKNRSLKRNYYV